MQQLSAYRQYPRTFGYNATDLELDSEDIQAGTGGLYTKLITRKHEATGSGEVPGRPARFQVGTMGDPDADDDVTYRYDAAGRIERITGPGLPAYGVVYTRLQDSELVEYARYKSDASATMATVQRGYEARERGRK